MPSAATAPIASAKVGAERAVIMAALHAGFSAAGRSDHEIDDEVGVRNCVELADQTSPAPLLVLRA